MSGDPTDAQLLTCKARVADAATFPCASANWIDVKYGNYLFCSNFSKTSDLVAYYYFTCNGGRL